MSIQEYLPEKSFFITIGTLLVGTALVLLIAAGIKYQKNKPEKEAVLSENRLVTNEQALQNIQILQTLDSDNDGLYDWEEALWGTSPLVEDTDEDGISDFDEVDQVKVEYNLEANTTPAEELTQLDLISRDLYSTIAVLGQQGKLEESQEQIQALFQEVVTSAFDFDVFTIADLTLGEQTPAIIEAYRNDLRSIINRYEISASDIVFISNNSTKEAKQPEALAIIDAYDSYIESLLDTTIPVEWQKYHLDVVNGVQGVTRALESILYSDEDPLDAASAATQLPTLLEYYNTALKLLLE